MRETHKVEMFKLNVQRRFDMSKKLISISALGLIVTPIIFWYFYSGSNLALVMMIYSFFIIMTTAIRKYKKTMQGCNDIGTRTFMSEYVTLLSGVAIIPKVTSLFQPLLKEIFNLLKIDISGDYYDPIIYIFLISITWILLYISQEIFFKDRSVMKKHSDKDKYGFEELTFIEKRKSFCKQLEIDLNNTNIETQWNDYFFTPLDADIEIKSGNKIYKKSTDLLKALKGKTNENAFLVLGEPGSGKSTILRKLALDLLKEVEKTNKIPIYFNLKEWDVKTQWNKENPPTTEDIYNFVFTNLKLRFNDIIAKDFIGEHLEGLYKRGYLFLIFDSFDEIPILLDEKESSWLVDKLSEVTYKFLASSDNSRAILSSRFFRKPTEKFNATTVMSIRPFDEEKIKLSFDKNLSNTALSKRIFSEKKELMGLAKNPFYASLISIFYKENNQLPTKQADLYENFITTRINLCEKTDSVLSKNGLKIEDIVYGAKVISYIIFNDKNHGFEIPMKDLIAKIPLEKPKCIIDILKEAKIIRVGKGENQSVSFSHRRFNEYFVACKLLDLDEVPHLNSIPTDSKWRDTLVLYAEICPKDKADELIDFCCQQLEKFRTDVPLKFDDDLYSVIHTLRFLVDAFASAPKRIEDFEDRIFAVVEKLISTKDILLTKIAAESVAIFSGGHIEWIIEKSFALDNYWVNESTISCCSHLDKMNTKISSKMNAYYLSQNGFSFMKRRKSIMFSLSLSNIFAKTQRLCRLIVFDLLLNSLSIFCFFLAFIANILGFFELNSTLVLYIILIGMLTIFRLRLNLSKLSIHAGSLFLGLVFFIIFLFENLGSPKPLYENLLHVFLAKSFFSIPYILWAIQSCRSGLINLKVHCKEFLQDSAPYLAIVVFLTPFGLGKFLEKYFLFIIGTLIFCILLVFLVYCYGYYRDYRTLKDFELTKSIKRKTISVMLESLLTERFKIIYLEKIRLSNIEATGEWENNQLPLNSQNVNTILAQLESKWMKL